jgi:hypothetical protein
MEDRRWKMEDACAKADDGLLAAEQATGSLTMVVAVAAIDHHPPSSIFHPPSSSLQ